MDKNESARKKGIFERIGTRVDDSIYNILNGLSSVIFGITGLFIPTSDVLNNIKNSESFIGSLALIFSSYWIYLILLGILLLIVGSVGNSREISNLKGKIKKLSNDNNILKKAETNLKEKIDEAEQELVETKTTIRKLNLDSIEIWLKVYSKQLELTNSDRVSLYYEDNKNLHILSRYSINPRLKEIHKQKFPLDKGVISDAWQNGVCYKVIPVSYSDSPSQYIKHCEAIFGYDEDEIKSLTMKSQLYFAKAITDADDHIGIIIFESYNPNLFDDGKKDEVKSFLESSSSLLTNLIKASKKFDQEMMNKTPSNATMGDEEELLKLAKKEAKNG
ncbi:hypothetical protein [Xenorhabdus szentirmaii]|uniref:GAF domain-containing protein n=2 Tax=Xenorhabdus szentirmaii TaxID=290112 RepID=W1J007_9GAMM|nr:MULTISPECIES: hypothetical protein [Xenorhabdus]MBD2780605.1 hypothetical protein [Xenorhabdus sp. 38]MBD2792830.1 hypothetical protein [Xenorhabdus sp. CUL]MBD2801020.1 hypothetical protein [Xenorhabdus sp. M]MBD2803216.1 hypothetical protein [Xenorhabdus sp. ZM]MBD2820299.1 hypothetical protein [Xenorhabdus sp. 42]